MQGRFIQLFEWELKLIVKETNVLYLIDEFGSNVKQQTCVDAVHVFKFRNKG